MRGVAVIIICVVCSPCSSKSEEESVVSVYTTQPTTSATGSSLDVYQQIANNIAKRITSPLYRFLGINGTTTTTRPTTSKWSKIETLDEVTSNVTNSSIHDSQDKSIETITAAKTKKADEKKPERITLYSSYEPRIRDLLKKNLSKSDVNILDNDDVLFIRRFSKPKAKDQVQSALKEVPDKKHMSVMHSALKWIDNVWSVLRDHFRRIF